MKEQKKIIDDLNELGTSYKSKVKQINKKLQKIGIPLLEVPVFDWKDIQTQINDLTENLRNAKSDHKKVEAELATAEQERGNLPLMRSHLQKFLNLFEGKLENADSKNDDGPEDKDLDIDELRKQIEEYVKIKSQQKGAISTVEKFIKFTEQQGRCFLCKQESSEEVVRNMKVNYNPATRMNIQ